MAPRVDLPALPMGTLLILAGFNVVGVAILVSLFGPGLLAVWALVAIGTGVQAAIGRQRMTKPFATRATPTGFVIPPPPPSRLIAGGDAPRRAWSGAALLPTALGGMAASAPLAELSIGDGELTVRVRPALFALLFGYRTTTLGFSECEGVLPVTRTAGKGLAGKGVAILPKGRSAMYFFTSEVPQILSELQHAGFPADWREQKVRLWARAR